MRLKKLIEEGFGNAENYNCSERLFAGANIAYGLGLPEDSFKTASCFGSGMMSGGVCGALTGSLMALGHILVADRAHTTETLRKDVQDFILMFNKTLGASDCTLLSERYRTEEEKCVPLQIIVAGILDDYLISKGILDGKSGEFIK